MPSNTPVPPPTPADLALDLGAAYERCERAGSSQTKDDDGRLRWKAISENRTDEAELIHLAETDFPAALRLAAHWKREAGRWKAAYEGLDRSVAIADMNRLRENCP